MTTITRELIAAYLNGEVKTLTNSEQKELARIALASLDADSDSNSHPAHGPVTLDRLHRISDILSKAAAQSDGGNLGYAMSDAVKAIDEALELRKAEPVAFINGAWTLVYYRPPKEAGLKIGDKLYTAPPAPVVPATLPCAVELKPGLIIGKGCKTETLLTALQRRADYYAEIDAMTPEERAEHEANIEAFKAMLPQPVPDERKAFEAFMDKRFGDTIDQRRAKNGDQGYMAWDMVVTWIVWQARAKLGSPPAPVVPEAKCDDDGNTTSEFDHGWNAAIARVKEMNKCL
ncbi:hypothetical protein I5466_09355 [Citrobacter koseri]|uniref:hypothetical protein n=1 Tax=Citrobacter koseri TaxID=545 RepID=UPI001908FC02|nr:hypothetical protein [Citrobacter koseri]MBJ9121011.1 hypothetical protein [Citrobacter koseri]